MWIIIALVIGFVVGAIAKLIMPGRDGGGFILTALLGMGGSIVASYLGQVLGWYAQGEPAGFISSIVGAMLLLALFRAVRKR